MTPRELVNLGIRQGWIKLPAPDQSSDASKYAAARRALLRARGLTGAGTPRRTQVRPQLTGLERKEYCRRYQELKRKGFL